MNQFLLVVTVLSLLELVGCVGATRVPEKVQTRQGIEKKIDLTFLQPGHTMHAEVRQKLAAIDTGFQSDRFFLGRWTDSKWGAWIVVAGGYSAAGNASRLWHNVNLLVEFDQNGSVTKFETFSDKLLVEKLTAVAANRGAEAARANEELQVAWTGADNSTMDVRFADGAIEFESAAAKKRYHFVVPGAQFEGIGAASLGIASDPVYTTQVLHFSTDMKKLGGPRGKTLRVRMTVPEMIGLLRNVS